MYKDSTLDPKLRAADLLSRMTLEEKFQQMYIYSNINELYRDYKLNGSFEIRGGTFGDPADEVTVNELQRYCVENTRLGIPMLIAWESLHGIIDPETTIFPQCAGIAGTFDPGLVYKMADTIGNECRIKGIRQVYAPCVDIPRDPRWGRTQESYGEDPYLSGQMGEAYVKGIQKHGVAATVKHFIAYGVPEGGINLATVHMGEREMREVTLEPFKRCIDAGVLSVMPAYNEVDGEPIHGSERYLQKLLREELGFDGMVISDYSAIRMFHSLHRTAPDALTAGKMAIKAGVDIEAPVPFGYGEDFRNAVSEGSIDIALVDRAVLNILTLKFRLGLFEDPYTCVVSSDKLRSDAAVELSRTIDEKSIILLENDGILPLSEEKIGKVAVIGNNAKNTFLGDYIKPTKYCVSIFDGLTERLGSERVIYAQGCNPISCTDEMIQQAVQTAQQAEVVILALGDRSSEGGGADGGAEGFEPEITCSEGYDTHDLDLPPSQRRLFDAIVQLNKPTVLILYAGRPYAFEKDIHNVNAFLFSWGGGEQCGTAVANLLFGDRSPSAKLSVSFPKTTGHIPCYYNYKPSARGRAYKKHGSMEHPGRDYVLSSPDPWYPFGYGLSYTKVEYSDLSARTLADKSVEVSVTLKNIGKYSIDESVLLFLQTLYAPITPFVKRLRKFTKVHLEPDEVKTVTLLLSDEDFTYVDAEYNTVKLPGTYKIMIDVLECEITVEV